MIVNKKYKRTNYTNTNSDSYLVSVLMALCLFLSMMLLTSCVTPDDMDNYKKAVEEGEVQPVRSK